MDYSTKAINSAKLRIEPVYVTDVFSGNQIEENLSDRFRIILFTEGNFSAEINKRVVQVISPAVLCLNETDSIKISPKVQPEIKCRIFLFNPRFLNKKLDFQNIRQRGMDAESEVIENRMILRAFINSSTLNYVRFINPEDRQHILELMDKAQFQLEKQDSGGGHARHALF